ncbi:MAG: T9SS type A sorting domain-containing protein, partial [Bacteroidetes bacterium]|nr:T9SS type A sorting domain-containing protein [Bacteroidota bacterium]
SATATDNCNSLIDISHTDVATTNCTGNPGVDRTWTATDGCQNTSSCVQHIVYVDHTAPVIGAPGADLVLNCPAEPIFTDPTFTDNCTNASLVLVSDISTPGSCPGTFSETKTWKAVDGCGNESPIVTQTITVVDVTPPAITCPADRMLPCHQDSVMFGTPTATDLCDGSPSLAVVSTTQVTNADGSVTYTQTWEAMDVCGNAARCSQSITVPPLYHPTITPGGSTTICNGGTVELCASTGTSYFWSTGATTQCITATSTGIYWVDVTNGNGCVGRDSITISIHPSPVCLIRGCHGTICEGQSTTICAQYGAGYTYLWSTGDTTRCITVSDSGDYTVTVTNEFGCTSQCSMHITVIPLPPCSITGNLVICQGQSTSLCAPAGYSYHWNTGSHSRCITVSCPGTYTVTVKNANGCSTTCHVCVTVIPPPSCHISGDRNICQGQTTELCAPVGYAAYHWSNGATTQCITVGSSGTYSVTVTNQAGCTSTCSACVKVSPVPPCCISGNSEICHGQSTSLCAPAGYTYLWSNGATTRCITVCTAGTYSVTVTNCNGCSSTCSKTVTVSTPPTSTITGDNHICQGQSTSLCAPAGYSCYHWSNGSTSRCITVSCAGTYSVTVTNAAGCSSTSSICVTVTPPPSSCISGNHTICQGQTTTLCAPYGCTGNTYLWSTGETTRCIDVSSAGTYSVTVTNAAGCSSTSSVCVTVTTPVTCTISGNTSICQGQSTCLCAPVSCGSYLWSNGATTRCITVGCAGTYSVTVTNASGCTSTCSVSVTVSGAPSSTITGNTHICQGQSTSLCAPAGFACYHWNTGATTRCITVSCAGTYSVTVTNAGGCSSTSSVCVTNTPLSCSISGNTNLCIGQTTTLCAPSGYTYHWNNGACSQSITVGCPGTYTVTITNANGCSSSCSVCVMITNCHGGCSSKSTTVNNLTPVGIEASTYPNPFNSVATIEFKNLSESSSRGTVEIYSLDGRKIAELFNGDVDGNMSYQVKWDAKDIADGTYLYRIVCGDNTSTGRLVLMKQ